MTNESFAAADADELVAASSVTCRLRDWSLRVTLVFRHERRAWRLVHRHADPLVHPISFERLGELARG